MRTYLERLEESARQTGNCACMGLDPQWDVLPYRTGHIREDIGQFFTELLGEMATRGLVPAAFKPNLGYYSVLDAPREGSFEGSLALADLLARLEKLFPSIPVILDAKRGDIARSSQNYASEAFDVWRCDAVTVSPYMGGDSVKPFLEGLQGTKGMYVLNRTSNPGARDLQGLTVADNMVEFITDHDFYPLHSAVARKIAAWAAEQEGTGAVVGATSLQELAEIASFYSSRRVPLLIPGVGSQGASAKATMQVLREARYPLELARINSSSALTHPWKKAPAPKNWLEQCLANVSGLLRETAL